MPTDWGENIILSELSDEPELSEEFAALFSALKEAPPGGARHVVLNFAGVRYLNSSHIAQLLRMRKQLQLANRSLVLCSLGDDVWSVLLLSGLDKVFRFAPDPVTALAGLQIEDQHAENA